MFCANEKSFYLQQSHIIMQMEDSLIILLLGSSFGFTVILYKPKCQPPALRDEHVCPVTINSLTSGKIFCYCGRLLSQNTVTEDEIIHCMRGLVLPVDLKLSTEVNVCCAVVLSALQRGCETGTANLCHTRRLDRFQMCYVWCICKMKCQNKSSSTEMFKSY